VRRELEGGEKPGISNGGVCVVLTTSGTYISSATPRVDESSGRIHHVIFWGGADGMGNGKRKMMKNLKPARMNFKFVRSTSFVRSTDLCV
jgi:hypothetical protein